MNKPQIGIFEYDIDTNLLTAQRGVGKIHFDNSDNKLSFYYDSESEQFDLSEGNKIFIKRRFVWKVIEENPDRKNQTAFKGILLYQNFLKESHKIINLDSFIFQNSLRILLCQSFIELLEENNRHTTLPYRNTYLELLKLNFELSEKEYDPNIEKTVDNLYYALKQWLNACKDPQNTIFEDEKIDREIETYKAIFKNGKVKKFFVEDKKGKDNNERFRNILERIGTEWLLKSRYDLKNAYKIFRLRRRFQKPARNNKKLSTEPKLKANWLLQLVILLIAFAPFLAGWRFNEPLILQVELGFFYGFLLPIPVVLYFFLGWQIEKMIIPRLAGTIVVGYIVLIVTADVWEFSLRYYQQASKIVVGWQEYLAIIIIALDASFIYLFIEVNNRIKNPKLALLRALSLFFLGATESFIIGLILFDLFADGMTSELMSKLGIDADKIRIKGIVGHIYPLPLILYASLALVIGIFVQIIWEDKPITEPL
jgi:hypothetical protein